MTVPDVQPDPGVHAVTVRVPFDVLARLLTYIARECEVAEYGATRCAPTWLQLQADLAAIPQSNQP